MRERKEEEEKRKGKRKKKKRRERGKREGKEGGRAGREPDLFRGILFPSSVSLRKKIGTGVMATISSFVT